MQSTRTILHLASAFALVLSPLALPAENGLYNGSGGSFSAPTVTGQPIAIQNIVLAGTTATLSVQCPITFFGAGTYQWKWTCSGGSIRAVGTGTSLALTGSFLNATMTLSGSGGGRGGHVTYWYEFSGTFSGKDTVNGASQGANGSIAFAVKTTAVLGSGTAPVTGLTLGWNSAYSPVLVASAGSSRLLAADNVTGLNLVSYGAWGSGTGQFESIAALARDASGHIYITDSSLHRLVRIDDLAGKNWLELGSYGIGELHFNNPAGVAIDGTGKIWVADSGNNRIVRFDDMTGRNWIAFGATGSGANQFSAPSAIAFDAQSRIYVADSGNGRLVRFDDITGKNWTTLSTINIDPYAYNFAFVNGVAILPGGKIVASTAGGWLYRIDDMTAANPVIGSWSPSITGISADPSGTLFVAGGFSPGLAQALDANGAGFFGGTMGQTPLQAGPVLALADTVIPPAAPIVSVSSLAFGNQNVGEPSAVQHITLSNIGGAALNVSSIAASPDYVTSSNCPAALGGGSSCLISISFTPTATGRRTANLSIESNGVHPLIEIGLSGTGTAPKAVLQPGSLTFASQRTTSTSAPQLVTLTNPGTGPLTIASIAVSPNFSASSNCPSVLRPGGGCALQVTFTPAATGSVTGGVTIRDDAIPGGASQVVKLSGTGSSTPPALTLTPESLLFPNQQSGVASAAQALTLKNGSAAAITLSAPVFPTGFKGSTTCGASLKAGGSCTINVQFAPAAAAAYSGSVSIAVGSQPNLSAGVAGTSVTSASPVLVASPSPLAFGVIVVGDNPSLNLTIHNPSGVPGGVRSAVLAGPNAFSTTGGSCPSILSGGASCTIQITWIPPSVGFYSASFTVTESSGAKTAVAVTGTATLDNGN